MRNNNILIDISKLKPFNCAYYQSPTLLSLNSLGFCKLEEGLGLKYCQANGCIDYIPKQCGSCEFYMMDGSCALNNNHRLYKDGVCEYFVVFEDYINNKREE